MVFTISSKVKRTKKKTFKKKNLKPNKKITVYSKYLKIWFLLENIGD